MRTRLVLSIILLCGSAPLTGLASAADEGSALFDAKVRAILVEKCLACHASDKKKGGLDLTRRASAMLGGDGGAAIVPGKPGESLLCEKVEAGDMPPKNRLAPDQVEALRAWVEAGAPFNGEPLARRRAGLDWWSLRPIARPEIPEVGEKAWVRTPVDAFILAKLEAAGLSHAPEADRATLIRRVSFDLLGLPPTPEEIDAFLRDDLPDAYGRLVDRLLDSPHYGERWGRHWLDVVRFGESMGYEMNHLRPNAWPYRDYVIRAFNRDTPLPRFALEQLAGDTLPADDPEADWLARSATGFLVAGTHDEVGNKTVDGMRQQRMDDLDDMISTTGTAFLGLTVACARCHDHKFDPIAQKDYYGLQAVFAGVQHAEREVALPPPSDPAREAARVASELAEVERLLDAREPEADPDRKAPARPAVNARRNVERFAATKAKGVRLTVKATNGASEPCLDEIEAWTAGAAPRDVALAESGAKATASSEFAGNPFHKIAHLNDGQVGNGRSWISAVAGSGIATVEWPEALEIDRIVWGRDRLGQYQDRLPLDYLVEIQEPEGRWRVVASSSDRLPQGSHASPSNVKGSMPGQAEERSHLLARQAELRAHLEGGVARRKVYAGTFSTPVPTHLLRRGDPMQEGEIVPPSAIASVTPALVIPADAPEPEPRAALAHWIGDPANPLPARVMVNRAWHYHFGRGIVATPGDFGFNGEPPTHPDLLDWLASRYREGGCRLKPIHRLIVLSAAYRQSSRIDPKAYEVDADNRLLWRSSPRRLEAESIRDAILAVSGKLDLRMGGPGYSLWEANTNYVLVYTAKPRLGPEEFRRMAYQVRPRSQQDPTFGAFDCPDTALATPRRTTSTTALQALNLLNSPFVLDQAEALAARLKAEAGDSPDLQARRGLRLAFGREPTAPELSAAIPLIRAHGLSTFCRSLFNANEFVYVP